MFDEILGNYNEEKESLIEKLKSKFDYFYPHDIVRVDKLTYRNGLFIFGKFQHTGKLNFKRFVLDELRDVFRLTGYRKITVTKLEYEEGILTVEDIGWTA